MCDCSVSLAATKYAKKCKKLANVEPVCKDVSEQPWQMPTMVRWAPPVMVASEANVNPVAEPHGGYMRFPRGIGFPKKPDIPGLVFGQAQSSVDMEFLRSVLNKMFKPVRWTEAKRTWIQEVSLLPGTRTDVNETEEELNMLLQKWNARTQGICPVRQFLIMQCFDEIIRQITAVSPEKGLLLKQVKDEIELMILVYQTLVDEAVNFGAAAIQALKEQENALKNEYEELANLKKELQWEYQLSAENAKTMIQNDKNKAEMLKITQLAKLSRIQRASDQYFQMLNEIGVNKQLFYHLV